MAAVLPLDEERDRAIKGRPDKPQLKVADTGPDLDVEEQEDGGAIVTEVGAKKPGEGTDFDENLATVLEETELDNIARDLLKKIEHDKDSRIKRDKQYAEGLKRTGLGEDAPGGAMFTGASKVTHPMLTEACVDFHASSMKELFPPSGPVRTDIIGSQTPEQLKVADRQFKYMNWQLTEQIEEYPAELAVTMTQLPMGGSQYMKFWPDGTEKRTCCEFVPIDDMLLPYACHSFWSSHRITHVQRLGESVYEDRVESGMYRDLEDAAPPETPIQTDARKASERIEGLDTPPENLDGLRLVYETNTYLRLKADNEDRLPYLISIDERTGKVLSIYRNWEEDDKRRKRLHWIVDYTFIPWRGAHGIGIAQILGGLSGAATGALRALLDSALVQTIPVLAKLKGAKFGAQSKTVDPMQIQEVEAGTSDDIRKVLMALPFNQPSPVLYALLGWLTDAAKGVVTTAEEKIADAGNNMPVGTSLALIEQGAKVFSAIHAGLHRSQKKALQIIARINKDGVDEEAQMEKFGEIIATAQDFRQPLGVIPVSDPNIFSEGQRYAQMQLVAGYAFGVDPKTGQPTSTAQLHNQYKVLKRSYELAKIPNVDELLPPPKEPTELNAAAENSAVMLGSPIQAFPDQNHLAHLETHVRFIIDPMFGSMPAATPKSYPEMSEHIKQHLSFLYAREMYELASEVLGADLSEALKDKKLWPQIDQLLASASRLVHDKMAKVLEPLGPEIQKMVQQAEAMKPPAPMDPSAASLKIAGMEDERAKKQIDEKAKTDAATLDAKKKKDAADAQAKAEQNRIKWEEIKLKYGQAKADAFREQMSEQERLAFDRAQHEHSVSMDHRSANREDASLAHGQSMDHRNAAREDQSASHAQRLAEGDQQHGQALDIAGHHLNAATAADESTRAGADLDLRADGQGHEQMMKEAEHRRGVQGDSHARAMAEASHEQGAKEHKDKMAADERRRKDEAARAKAEAKAKSQAPKKPKPGGK